MWEVETAPLRALKAALHHEFEEDGTFDCPYCGTEPANSFDHYLPRESYPEFAATAENLVRSCSRCNLLKGATTPSGGDRFLHPMWDEGLELELVLCEIDDSHEPPVPKFAINAAHAALAGIEEELRFHFECLRLKERFERIAAPELGAFLIELQSSGLGRGTAAATIAARRAAAYELVYGPNRWSAVFYRGVAKWLS